MINDHRVASTGCQKFSFGAPLYCQNLPVVLLLSIKVCPTGCPKGYPPIFASSNKLRSFKLSITDIVIYYLSCKKKLKTKNYIPG